MGLWHFSRDEPVAQPCENWVTNEGLEQSYVEAHSL